MFFVCLKVEETKAAEVGDDDELRQWAENWLKNKERTAVSELTDAEFDKHWLYVRPERMHEGAIEAVAAYRQSVASP